MDRYLKPTDKGAFKDMKVRGKATAIDKGTQNLIKCPKCKGYGGWHLKIDAYGKDKHFDAGCDQCNSWGWVNKDSKDATCLHKWGSDHGKCMFEHTYMCTKCGTEITQYSDG